nr:M4 family metallopeptidase [Bacteroidota bacterium]
TSISDQDLLGQNRTVNAYLVGSNFFMIDASRNGMFQSNQSVMPNEPLGVIWSIDAQNGSPQKDNFEVVHISNTNNNWSALEVSAHFNAGESYEYFRTKFNRNSLNGDGGNIISIINVTDENGNDMDNAFWGGQAMFYGNGDTAFKPLAQGLDVAGHEMSHGVIQNTANLEYIGQSGALNESYADVFGAMIDRDDWKMGEDVVISSVFPSGALRDLSNPHNGGNSLGDRGWQPAHMNEFQNLPLTPEGDNGGVHVNSGIPNRAFFLFATSIGKEKAEQIYYKALRDYLVKSSQFIDMRNAIEKAATDLHGANSAEVTAARAAFDGVGIGSGQGDDHQDDIETNEGSDFILTTDEPESDLYWVPPTNPNALVKLDLPAPLSRPSFTDDGTTAVYVDQNNRMILISFDWSQGLSYQAFFVEQNPQTIWRNIVVSKDGTKIAFTTVDLINEINLYDYSNDIDNIFTLYNPTTAEGIVTGDVLYADAMEWDYSGEYIMYDALNRIESSFGDGIEYWDIGFINVWDESANNFADGLIGKLYSSLPENVSVGNPSFAKNSPYIITFDYVEDFLDNFGQVQTDYLILASNIESGVTNEIFFNTTVGYPSYSRLDDQILFTNDNGSLLLATIDLQQNDKTLPIQGSAVILVNGAQKGVWFQTGTREFTGVEETKKGIEVSVYPQPATSEITLSAELYQANYAISDISGKVLLTGLYFQNESIQISSLLPGIYVVRLSAETDSPLIGKFIKQ